MLLSKKQGKENADDADFHVVGRAGGDSKANKKNEN